MHARITHTQIKPEHVDEAIRLFRDTVVPASRSQPGFQGAELFVDRASGKGIAVVFYDSRDSADATERSGFVRQQLARFAGFFTAPPQRELYEVAVTEAPKVSMPAR